MDENGSPAERKAKAEAEQAEAELTEWKSELAKQAREATWRQAIAEADKAASDAQRAQISALIPDFSKIEKGETSVKGEQAAFGTMLGQMALKKAAEEVVKQLKKCDSKSVLITADADLASTDIIYFEVVTGLDTLIEDANKLLAWPEEGSDNAADLALASSALGAIASAVPGLLSLFSANRTLSSFTSTADTKAAVAAVASGLITNGTAVQIDDFRIANPDGCVVDKEEALRKVRFELVKHKFAIEEDKGQANKNKKAALNEISDLIKRIDAFLSSLHTIPSGGKRSPFGIAILRQHLHTCENEKATPAAFTNILFVEASAGAVDQLINDRPLWSKDILHLVGSVAITYWLLDTANSNIKASGVALGMAELKGKIGNELTPQTKPVTS